MKLAKKNHEMQDTDKTAGRFKQVEKLIQLTVETSDNEQTSVTTYQVKRNGLGLLMVF